MRFCDLFISYKIGLKGIRNTIPFTNVPLYGKVSVIAIFIFSILSTIFFMLKFIVAAIIALILVFSSFVIFLICDSRKRNLEIKLNDNYLPYSQKRMNMVVEVLRSYGIDISNPSSIDLIIEEAKIAQVESDYSMHLKKPVKILGGIIIPIIVWGAQKIGDSLSQDEMITISSLVILIIVMIFSIIIAGLSVFKDIFNLIFNYDYDKYRDLIYDLRQIKIFYAQKHKSY